MIADRRDRYFIASSRVLQWNFLSLIVLIVAGIGGDWQTWAANPAADANWPQWRGPLGTGFAPLGDPPVEWSQDKNVQWKVKLPGSGTSAAIVWDNMVFTQTAIPTGVKPEGAPATAEKPAEPAAPAESAPPRENRREGEGSGTQTPAGDRPAGEGEGGERRGRRRGGGGGGNRAVEPTEIYKFALLCLDRETGKLLWERVVREELPHEGHHPSHGFASYSPVTDGTRVIAFFGSRGLHCFDMQGNLKWSKDLGRMQTSNSFGEGSSPALYGNTVVVNWDHEGDDFVAAFDATTGNELWRTPREEERSSWATPLVVEHNGKAEVITTATGRIRSYDLATGQMVWDHEGLTSNAIPTPVARGGVVYATSGFRGSKLFAIRLGDKGDLTDTESVAWKYDKDTPYVPSPVLAGDRLYFYKSNNGIVSCINVESGSLLFGPERVEGVRDAYASPVANKDRVYLVGRDGTTVVIRNADKFEVLATNLLGEDVDASPSIAGNQLFIRGKEHLYCLRAQ